MPLPACPHCQTEGSLEAVRAEARGVKVCVCSVCAKLTRVDADGHVVWQRPDR
jgi:hypothetical protein